MTPSAIDDQPPFAKEPDRLGVGLTKKPEPTTDSFSLSKVQATDIDRNGRVDILDAFKLARHIESAGRTETEWDFNGDGLIDRSDVDVVANAAVRLDKGVL